MGFNVKKIRTKLFMTQEELSKELGVHISTIKSWELNISVPSLRNQRKIVELCKKNNIDWRE